MNSAIADVIDQERYPLDDAGLRMRCKRSLDENGVLVLPNFLTPTAIASIQREGLENQHLAYYTINKHNIYLTEPDPEYLPDHPRNREVSS